MAQTNPYLLRLSLLRNWRSQYILPKGKESEFLRQDFLIRKAITALSRDVLEIEIKRTLSDVILEISVSNSGYITDRNNAVLNKMLEKSRLVLGDSFSVKIRLIELRNPFLSPQYIANLISSKIKARTPFRVALRTALSKVSSQIEVDGVRIRISGRLDGSEIAKTEKVSSGKIPLNTLSSKIEFASSEAIASYGVVCTSVWICRNNKQFKPREFPRRGRLDSRRDKHYGQTKSS